MPGCLDYLMDVKDSLWLFSALLGAGGAKLVFYRPCGMIECQYLQNKLLNLSLSLSFQGLQALLKCR